MATKARLRWFWWALLVACLLLWTAWNVRAEISNHLARREARHWLQRAQQAITSQFTYDNAYQWFGHNGFRVAEWSPLDSDWIAKEEHHNQEHRYREFRIVLGERLLRGKGLLKDPIWLRLVFRFSTDGQFRQVDHYISSFPMPQPEKP